MTKRRVQLVERWTKHSQPNNGSGCKLTSADAAIFGRLSWLRWSERPGREAFDVTMFLKREGAYLQSLNL
jgi:hypothetical protein